MAEHVQVDACPVCGSPVYARLVPPTEPVPPLQATCRCRVVYPDRFKTPGQHGYGRTGRPGIRR